MSSRTTSTAGHGLRRRRPYRRCLRAGARSPEGILTGAEPRRCPALSAVAPHGRLRRGPPLARKALPVDFAPSAKAQDYLDRLQAFMDERVFPAEAEYERYRAETGREDHTLPPVVEELKAEARTRGLWNLFLPDVSGLTNVEYAPLAELTGWGGRNPPPASNCDAPNNRTHEVLPHF